MQRDPFRDLAYQIKSLGGFNPVPVFYQEFRWANYFRDYIPFPHADNLVISLPFMILNFFLKIIVFLIRISH